MAYEDHCIKLIDSVEYERRYKEPLPTEMKLVVDTLNDFIMNGGKTAHDHQEGDDKTFKHSVLWLFRDGGICGDEHENWCISSNSEDGFPAFILNDNGKWYIRDYMSESDDRPIKGGWKRVVEEFIQYLTLTG
jgi:hypothetical protein